MAKKKRTTKTVHHKTHIVHHTSHPNSIDTIPLNTSQMLLENFVSLQRVLTNLSVKLEGVATQMSKLLDLFEISAKALAEKDFDVEKDNKDILAKLDMLQDQNKTLARGISLLHERPREPMMPLPPSQPMMQIQPQMQQSMQQMPMQTQMISPKRQEIIESQRNPQRRELPDIPRKQSPIRPKAVEAQPEEEEEEFIEESEDFDVPRFESPNE